MAAQVELSIHPQEICFITNLKEEDRRIIYPPAVAALTITATDAPLQRKWEQEADFSTERLIFSELLQSLIDTETTCSYAPAAGLAAATKSTQSH